MRLVLYTGKGGVGKTTTAAATAVRAAECGQRTLLASADAAHSLGDVLEQRLAAEPIAIAPGLDAVEIDARFEVKRHWGRVREFLIELFVHQGIDALVAEELALLPGVEELTALLAIDALASSGDYDLVVVDCAPTDASLRLLTLPDLARRSLRVLLPAARVLSGMATPLARRLTTVPLPGSGVFKDVGVLLLRRLRALKQRLEDPLTSVRIVVTPERMVINEARRLFTELSLFEVSCDAVIMNRLLPEVAAAEDFFREWGAVAAARRREVEALFAPVPVLGAPLREEEVTGLERLSVQGAELFSSDPPQAMLCTARRIRFERTDAGYCVRVPLPGADPAQLDVVKIDDELTITTGASRRSIVLPRRVAPLDLVRARLDAGELVASFRSHAPVS